MASPRTVEKRLYKLALWVGYDNNYGILLRLESGDDEVIEKIAVNDVPRLVVDAIERVLPQGKIAGALKEAEPGDEDVTYRLKLGVNGSPTMRTKGTRTGGRRWKQHGTPRRPGRESPLCPSRSWQISAHQKC